MPLTILKLIVPLCVDVDSWSTTSDHVFLIKFWYWKKDVCMIMF